MSKTPSIKKQVADIFKSQLRIGESKYQAKLNEHTPNPNGIFSWETYHTYVKECTAFGSWAKETHDCRTMNDAKKFAPEYIEEKIKNGASNYTIKLQISAINKLYNTHGNELGMPSVVRKRADIKRSRNKSEYDEIFYSKHKDIIDFARGTGLRRHEINKVSPQDVSQEYNNVYIKVKGKGGKTREVLVDPNYKETILYSTSNPFSKNLIFETKRISEIKELHSNRAIYAKNMYEYYSRPLETLKNSEKYFCRGDKKGVVYDREAMLMVSRQLGHERVNVIASNYLYSKPP